MVFGYIRLLVCMPIVLFFISFSQLLSNLWYGVCVCIIQTWFNKITWSTEGLSGFGAVEFKSHVKMIFLSPAKKVLFGDIKDAYFLFIPVNWGRTMHLSEHWQIWAKLFMPRKTGPLESGLKLCWAACWNQNLKSTPVFIKVMLGKLMWQLLRRDHQTDKPDHLLIQCLTLIKNSQRVISIWTLRFCKFVHRSEMFTRRIIFPFRDISF